MVRRTQQQFLVAIDDRAGLQQDGRHAGRSQHMQLIESVNTRFGLHEFSLSSSHDRFGVMRGVLQPSGLQLIAEKLAEEKTALAIAVVVGDEDGVTFEPVAEAVLLSFVITLLLEKVRHRVMVDREQEIGLQSVGARDAPDESGDGRTGRHQQDGAAKACAD